MATVSIPLTAPCVPSSQDALVPLVKNSLAYGAKDDPHTQAMQNQIRVIKEFDLSKKIPFLETIITIQQLVDWKRYSFGAQNWQITEVGKVRNICEVYMEDPLTGKEIWVPVSTGLLPEVFVNEVAHFACRKFKIGWQGVVSDDMQKILSEIDPLFTPAWLKFWKFLLELGNDQQKLHEEIAKAKGGGVV